VTEVADRWVPSVCALCYGSCSIRAHVVDGVVVKIEGNPESALGAGRLCGKGIEYAADALPHGSSCARSLS